VRSAVRVAADAQSDRGRSGGKAMRVVVAGQRPAAWTS